MTEPTGWPPSALMQDDCKALSKWLAKRACCICWKRKVKGQTMTEPTDAEIDEIYRSTFLAMPNVARQPPQTVPPMVRDFARAVLAKWGTPPAVAGEPDYATFALWYADHIGDENKPVRDAALATYEAFAPTQPTQAQAGAVPLTPEQITAAAKKLAECMEYPWDHMPEQGRAEMRKHARAVIAAANGSPPPTA